MAERFFNHIIRKDETLATQIQYILDNPARERIASSWRDYPYKGSIGCILDDVLNNIV
jgi:predicted component of type VI protein secretion system